MGLKSCTGCGDPMDADDDIPELGIEHNLCADCHKEQFGEYDPDCDDDEDEDEDW